MSLDAESALGGSSLGDFPYIAPGPKRGAFTRRQGRSVAACSD